MKQPTISNGIRRRFSMLAVLFYYSKLVVAWFRFTQSIWHCIGSNNAAYVRRLSHGCCTIFLVHLPTVSATSCPPDSHTVGVCVFSSLRFEFVMYVNATMALHPYTENIFTDSLVYRNASEIEWKKNRANRSAKFRIGKHDKKKEYRESAKNNLTTCSEIFWIHLVCVASVRLSAAHYLALHSPSSSRARGECVCVCASVCENQLNFAFSCATFACNLVSVSSGIPILFYFLSIQWVLISKD